jgi:DNA-binding XRE family transcriptional regulator
MAYPAYIREKARQLRIEKKLTIDEIAERLAISRTTIYYWVRDLPIERKPHPGWPASASYAAARSNRRRFKALRDAAYQEGSLEFEELDDNPTFRDFVCMYIGEGYKRDRNRVAIGNSDPAVLRLAIRWMRLRSANALEFALQYHEDQDLASLRSFWAGELGIAPESIRLQRKSNSNGLAGRNWRSRHGVLSICANDTYFRARLQAWMDRIRAEW